jgi:aminocarboxymuconate-semialdehyde decarboxylase
MPTSSNKKIDCHAHIMPPGWESLKDKYGYGGFIELKPSEIEGNFKMYLDDGTFFREVKKNCYDPDAILPEMDEYGVDKMVLCTIPVLFNYWAKPAHTADWASFLNEHITSVQEHVSNRFIGLGTLPVQEMRLAIKSLEHCKKLKLPGVQIGSNINNVNLDDERFHPLWEAAQEMDMAIFVHPWEMMGSEFIKKYWLPWLVGMPAETSRAICSMLFGGIFDKFPKLRVMFAHAGGSFPFTLGRIAHGWNCRPDLVNLNEVDNPKEYIGKFWVDGITHDQDAFRYLLKLMGEDKICYGTDYPFPLGDLEHGKFIEEMNDLSLATKNKVFSENIKVFLNID